jgi:hypothetical protein
MELSCSNSAEKDADSINSHDKSIIIIGPKGVASIYTKKKK